MESLPASTTPAQVAELVVTQAFKRNCNKPTAQILADTAAEILGWRNLQGRYSATVKALKMDFRVSIEQARAMACIALGLSTEEQQQLKATDILLGNIEEEDLPG